MDCPPLRLDAVDLQMNPNEKSIDWNFRFKKIVCLLRKNDGNFYLQQISKHLMLGPYQQVCRDVHRPWHFSHNNSNRRTGNRHLVAPEYSDMDTHCFDCMIHECRICSRNHPVRLKWNEINNNSAVW